MAYPPGYTGAPRPVYHPTRLVAMALPTDHHHPYAPVVPYRRPGTTSYRPGWTATPARLCRTTRPTGILVPPG